MKDLRHSAFSDRLQTGQKARAEQLERVRAKARAAQEGAAEREAARRQLVAERDARKTARAEAKREEAERLKAARAAEEEARIAAEKAAIEERDRKKNEDRAKLAQILVDQKAARDARYAARKARSGKK
ncbi:MAG TPA: DUF6481 family protein [Rhizomicrobium sp.]|jgi:hypothetical protein